MTGSVWYIKIHFWSYFGSLYEHEQSYSFSHSISIALKNSIGLRLEYFITYDTLFCVLSKPEEYAFEGLRKHYHSSFR